MQIALHPCSINAFSGLISPALGIKKSESSEIYCRPYIVLICWSSIQ